MCGRYSKTFTAAELALRFEALLPDEPGPEYAARYNVAPSQAVPVVVAGPKGNRAVLMRWGLIPSWAKDPSAGFKGINARGETLREKPSFKGPFERSRCLVPADGFYEWDKAGGRGSPPMRITRADARPFAMAGLWDRWRDPAGNEMRTFAIVTTGANAALAPLHDRMPVMLDGEGERRWIDPRARLDDLEALLRPIAAESVALAPASKRVNAPANDSPACLDPDPPQSGEQTAFL